MHPATSAFDGSRHLADEIRRVQAEIRAAPVQSARRSALFQLQCVAGAWDKATRQLAVVGDLDPAAELFCTQHRVLLAGEATRLRVFAGHEAPSCLGEPPQWVALLVGALRHDGDGRHQSAKQLREQAFAQAAAASGTLDGTSFAWLADADERLGPVLEAIVNGRYLWIPIERLSRLTSQGPKDLKDVVWLPVTLTLANEGEIAAFVPTRYPGSEAIDDDAIRLARRTEWRQLDGGSWVGFGQRMLATDAGEHPLLDIRTLELRPAAADD